MRTLPLSLLVITRNEAPRIGRCLDSVPFAAEKLVVDGGSDDDTVAVARAHGARVLHNPWPGFGAQRNFASGQSTHDWILALDADEYLSPALAEELALRLPALMAGNAPAAYLRRRTIYMGAPMRWYRPATGEKLARLYHRDRARWSDARVHETLVFAGAAPTLRQPFWHANNPTLVDKQLKVLRYAELKCLDWRDQRKSGRMWQAPGVFALAFLKDYIVRLALLDGWRGFIIAWTAANYALYKRMRYYEMLRNPGSVDTAAQALEKHAIEP
ncbi:MAG: glycosyltransferase family 2 protein [Rhodanobacter sp.]